MKYRIISYKGYDNWLIEEHVKNCGYCKYAGRKFTVYSRDRYSTFEVFFDIGRLRLHTLKKDIKNILSKAYDKKAIKKAYKIERVRE